MDRLRNTPRNLLHVIGGEMLLRLANFGVAVLIARVFGAASLGVYAAILAVATLAERLSDNGLEIAGIAETSRHPANISRTATALYINKTIFSLLAIGALAALGWSTGLSGSHWLIASILTLRTFLYSYCRLNNGLLKALDKAPLIARIQSMHFLVLCFAIAFVYLRGESLAFLLICLLVAQFLEFLLSLRNLRILGVHFGAASSELCWNLARRSTPIGLTYTLSTLMLRGDILVLSLLATASLLGTFSAADNGLVMVYVVAWLFSGVLLADLGRLSSTPDEFDAEFRKCVIAILALCIPLAVAAMLVASPTIRLLYGKSFAAAGLPAAIMCVAVPLIFLNAAFLGRAIARSAASIYLTVYAAAAALSLALNFLLGWRFGIAGIAVSIVLRELAITLAFVRLRTLPAKRGQPVAPFKSSSDLAEVVNT